MKKIKFKMINDEQFTLDVEDEKTVLQMKEMLFEAMSESNKIEVKDLKFIFMGSILQDDQKLKDIKGINQSNEQITFFVMGKSKKAAQPPPSAPNTNAPNTNYAPPPVNNQFNMGMPNEMFSPNHLTNIIGQSIDQISRNPQMLDMYYGQMMAGMSEPEKEVFRNNLINQLKELQKNPQSMMQAMNSLNMNPDMMRFQQPQYYPQTQVPCNHGFYPPNYNMNQGYPPMNYTPSPYMVPNNVPADINFEEIYKNELAQLESIGFPNKKLNLEALKKAKGDVNMAVNFLCEWTN